MQKFISLVHFSKRIGFNCQAQHAELVLSDPNPVLIYRISDEETRVLVDVRSQTLPKNIKEYLLEKTLPTLPGKDANTKMMRKLEESLPEMILPV